MKVSIIIANHRWDELFKKTIDSILNKGQAFVKEVIVVNNGLKADKADKVRRWLKGKGVRLLQIQEGNPSKARNVGAAVAKGKYLLFLDNDTQLVGGLEKVVRYLDKHPKVGAGQMKLLRMQINKGRFLVYDSAGEMLTKNGFLVERAREAADKGQFDKPDYIFSGKGAAMMVRKSVFEKIGGFDEQYVYYWEEPDLFWRVWKAGYEVRFLYMGVVEHAYGTKLKPVPKMTAVEQVYLACRNQVMTVLKNGKGLGKWQMLVGVGLSWLGLQVLFLLKLKLKHVWAIERAWFWLWFHSGVVARKRRWIKRHLKGKDDWMDKVLVERDKSWYLGKAKAYVSGRPF